MTTIAQEGNRITQQLNKKEQNFSFEIQKLHIPNSSWQCQVTFSTNFSNTFTSQKHIFFFKRQSSPSQGRIINCSKNWRSFKSSNIPPILCEEIREATKYLIYLHRIIGPQHKWTCTQRTYLRIINHISLLYQESMKHSTDPCYWPLAPLIVDCKNYGNFAG